MRNHKLEKKYYGAPEESPRFRTPYSLPHQRTSDVAEFSPSMTKQAEMAGCDINNIMRRYEETGILPDLIKTNPQYGDFADATTYQESLHLVQFASEQFAGLSAQVRKEFDNDPVKFLEFTGDSKNAERMAELGLMSPDAVERVQAAKKASEDKARAASEHKGKAKKDSDTES